MISLYIHLPFCRKKCAYCDFASTSKTGDMDAYLRALDREINLYKEELRDQEIRTIYLGGGTPSVLGQGRLVPLFEKIQESFNLTKDMEWTMEVNPESGKDLDFQALNQLGLNRVSMGIQSGQKKFLDLMGRIHSLEDVDACLNQLAKSSIEEVNGDFIFGLPGQDLNHVKRDLDYIQSLALTHLSYYSFIPEEGTPLGEEVLSGLKKLPKDQEDRLMDHYIQDRLAELGYQQYELSNFTKKNPCRHNLAYWQVQDYLGLGLSAHSSYRDQRWANTTCLTSYMEDLALGKKPIAQREKLSDRDRLMEKIILSLRLNSGIPVKDLEEDYGIDFRKVFSRAIEKNIQAQSLEEVEGTYRLTSYGQDVANQVELDFYRTF